LDPLATGVLPIAVGEATKCISFVQEKNKKYSFTVKWGERTETDDSEGKVIQKSDNRPTEDQILKVISSFIGEIFQKPPIYSAIKINGQRSYKLARKKIFVEHKLRRVEIHKLILKKITNNDCAHFEVTCSKGTYIRSLARDIAEKLNTTGHISALRRLSVGNFVEKNTIFMDFSNEIIHSPAVLNNILPIEAVLDDIPALPITKHEARKLKLGQKIQLNSLEFKNKFITLYPCYNKFKKICAINDNHLVALIEIEEGLVKPKRIINY
jgi:tRNA pseudouridine55 synthase